MSIARGHWIALGAVLIGALLDLRLGLVLLVWLGAWGVNSWLAASGQPAARFAVPAIFGATLLVLWEMVVRL